MMAATSKNAKNKENNHLVDWIFSWSIPDVMNRNLFLGKVKPIPRTFSSKVEYFQTFIYPLLEETHADLYSNMTQVPRAPFCEAYQVKKSKDCKLPNNLIYIISFPKVDDKKRGEGKYKPQIGDLIALTSKKPKCIDDLNTSRRPYTLGYIQGKNDEDSDEFLVVSSKLIEFMGREDKLFAVYLINLTTNIRIWKALHPDPEVANMNIINNILGSDLKAGKECDMCSSNGSNEDIARFARHEIQDIWLDRSQEFAVLDFVALEDCHHQNTVKLIWGPPGTGKTKTVASLLKVLLKMKCRTLTCAPTNIAVVNVATRLINLLKPSLKHDNYGLGDIVLFGNGDRMKIDGNEDLCNVFLNARVSAISECLNPIIGWKGTLQSMKSLLEDPQMHYKSYLQKEEEKERQKDDEDDDVEVKVETFWEFYLKIFNKHGNMILHFLKNLCTHLPTCLLQEELVKEMIKAKDSLQSLGYLIGSIAITDDSLHDFASEKIHRARCLCMLKFLDLSIDLNNWIGTINSVERFCLENAYLIFCTASSSSKIHVDTKKQVDLLVIDEAAQLKECESTIPLQLQGLRHALLIGDEMQLPAMVQSKICERSDFGRSLFERLVMLGYEKHLLNVQYRMHPSISLFPSREFYQNKIEDGPNVKEEKYKRRFLDGVIYGPCSFIDINSGREHFENGYSKRNDVEASVVADIVSRLHKKSVALKQKCHVGCISPYKDQVYAIQEKINGKYNTSDADSDFSVDVRSVDGFQGAEEDIIIISTVRCNGAGTVGFLSNHQRTNVALTRARHCLWILGNSTTLINSGSIWKKLVMDLKSRGCFFNANEDKTLAQAISCALIDLKQFDKLFNIDSLLFKSAKWKVCFGDEFSKSLAIQDSDIQKEVISIISNLSSGWRPPHEEKYKSSDMNVASSILEICDVNQTLKVIWNIDIQKDNSTDIQVLKIQDVIHASDIKKLVTRLNNVFENYSFKTIDRCRQKQIEGKIVVPMKWPIVSNSQRRDEDFGENLSCRLSAISLIDE